MPKLKITTEQRDNKDIIFDILEKNNIKSVTVTFDGSGDSGQIEDIIISSEKLLESKVEGATVNKGTVWDGTTSKKQIEHNPSLREVLEELCYELLEGVSGGWEIDEGSYGEFVFDVDKRSVRLDFNERIQEVQSTLYNF
jgi:hypothetical protein